MRDTITTPRLAATDRPTATHTQPLALRNLLARLTGDTEARHDEAVETPGLTFQQRQAQLRQRLLRDEAHAAFRATEGAGAARLDPALAVLEGEIARLQSALEEYGEALKTIRAYGTDPEQRAIATAALTATPMVLRAAAPVPSRARTERGHG